MAVLPMHKLVPLLLSLVVSCQGHSGTPDSSAFVHNNRRLHSQHHQNHRQRTWCSAEPRHTVEGIECVEVTLQLPLINQVTVLEATAESQEVLVNLALEEEDDDTASSSSRQLQQQQQLQAGDPYGAVLWPASLAISTHLLTAVDIQDQTVLELGAGTGLVSLAACGGGAKTVLATDYEAIPLQLLQYAADKLNPSLNITKCQLTTQLFDLCDESVALPFADWVVAADIMYEPVTGTAMAVRALEALKQGSRVLIGDSPGRAGRPAFLKELQRLGVSAAFVDTVGSTVSGARHELICGKESTTVSEEPQELTIAIMELDPAVHLPKGTIEQEN